MPNHTLSKPAQGAATVTVAPGQPLAFDFDHFNALFDRTDDALVLTFDDGSTLTLDGFFATGEGGFASKILTLKYIIQYRLILKQQKLNLDRCKPDKNPDASEQNPPSATSFGEHKQ